MTRLRRRSWAWLGAVALTGALSGLAQTSDEPFRPQVHFTPASGWMNDPNGLVYLDGEYHLFYQHNPRDTKWGPMHWGHAVSRDLLRWQHLPIALQPDKIGNIFSGSAVIDKTNSAGFGAGAMVAVFTHEKDGKQMQSLAYSTDHGRSWAKYAGNPVLEPPANIRNFRDPKVFWYGSSSDGHWVMLLAVGNAILFYESKALKIWTPSGGFGFGAGATCGVWETPDLFELPVDGEANRRWVLTVGVGDCAPAGGSGTQYFVGQFDGKTFKSDNPKDAVLWADFGPDFYAAQSWNDAPGGRRVLAAWMSNWRYAERVPTSGWRGALTLPRDLGLRRTRGGLRLTQQPIRELEQLRGKRWSFENLTVRDGQQQLEGVSGERLEIRVAFRFDADNRPDRLGLRVRVGKSEQTTIGFNTKASKLFVDRSRSGRVDFAPGFPGVHLAPLELADGEIRLHLIVDRSSVEVMTEDGLVAMTESIFPDASSTGVQLFAEGVGVVASRADVFELKTALTTSR